MPVPAQGEYDLNSKFSIHASQWCGWQMNPGYFGERCVPYFSPIYVTRVTPLKTGKGILETDFFNACYADGGRRFTRFGDIVWSLVLAATGTRPTGLG